jgi:hypothetical protein
MAGATNEMQVKITGDTATCLLEWPKVKRLVIPSVGCYDYSQKQFDGYLKCQVYNYEKFQPLHSYVFIQ